MIRRNPNFANLKAGYIFPEIAKRRREFQAKRPGAKVISLGVGNTTEPLSPAIVAGLEAEARALGTKEGYSGYGDEQGLGELRARIAEVLYKGIVAPEEVFVSDGAKCDIGRVQTLIGSGIPVAVQDPAYPVYVDGSVISGAAGAWEGSGYRGIAYLPCTAENGFFPDLASIPRNGILYFCSPNNPTGAVATRAQLASLVAECLRKGALIVFDSAYAEYISDPELPKSVFEIPGARECAIEISSFSKPIGFTGVRLGWSVVPRELRYADGGAVIDDWNRIMTTIFNGASNIAQHGGLAALSPGGVSEMRSSIAFYMGNARIVKTALDGLGVQNWGGVNAPYIWARFPGRKSWDVFEEILDKCEVVTTPGAGFGSAGESFIRFSAFGHRQDVEEAAARLKRLGASIPS
jgi:LL-diaminopimelate aminotransferase